MFYKKCKQIWSQQLEFECPHNLWLYYDVGPDHLPKILAKDDSANHQKHLT